MRRYLAVMALSAALVACAAQPPPAAYSEAPPMTAAVAKLRAEAKPPPPPVDVCDATISNPHLIMECAAKPDKTPGQMAQHSAQLAHDAAVTHAAADCNYQAKVAGAYNYGSAGLIGGLVSGIIVGNACEDYYRNIGVTR